MARISKGILGGISGSIGNVVGGSWRGIDYIRSKPSSVKNPNTPAQQQQRLKFKLVSGFIRQIQPLVVAGYPKLTGKQTPVNVAMSWHIKEAVTGTFPDFTLDLNHIRFSVGNLAVGESVSVDASVAGVLTLNWLDTIASGSGSGTDGVMALLVQPDTLETVYTLYGATRADQTLNISIPANWQGLEVAAYLGFRSENGKEVSNTQYLGTVTAG